MKKHALTGKVLLFAALCAAALAFGAPLYAAESDQDFIDSIVNNKFLQENKRLMGLAESSYTEGKYDDAVKYAQEAALNAQKSDEWIRSQLKMREAVAAVDAAQARFDWATSKNAAANYPKPYEAAKTAMDAALDAKAKEDWDAAIIQAKNVMDALAGIPGAPTLAAQYKVNDWKVTKDCLWNIAAKPQIYGDPFKWRVIYNANKSKFPQPNNPNIVEPGTILDIPSIKGEKRFGLLE